MRAVSWLATAALATGIASTGWAAGAPPAAKACFQLNRLQSTRSDGDRTVYARVGTNEYYRIDLAFACPTLLSQNGIVIEPTGGTNLICGPLDFDLKAREIGGGRPVPCMVKSVTRLTPEEVAAIPRKAKP